MSRSIIKTSKAPAPVGPYSQAVRCGNLLFVSGQIPLDPENGELLLNSFAEQCHRVLLNLKCQILLTLKSNEFYEHQPLN